MDSVVEQTQSLCYGGYGESWTLQHSSGTLREYRNGQPNMAQHWSSAAELMQFHAWEHGPLPTFWAVWAQRLEKKKPLTTQRCRETKKTKCENSENMWNCERKTFKSNCALTLPSVQSVWQSDAISPKPWKDENVAVRLASMEAVRERDRDNLGTPVFFIESESWSSTSYARISLLVAEERHWHSGIPDGLH